MKHKFCSIRINVTKDNVTFGTKGVLTLDPSPLPRGYATATTSKYYYNAIISSQLCNFDTFWLVKEYKKYRRVLIFCVW